MDEFTRAYWSPEGEGGALLAKYKAIPLYRLVDDKNVRVKTECIAEDHSFHWVKDAVDLEDTLPEGLVTMGIYVTFHSWGAPSLFKATHKEILISILNTPCGQQKLDHATALLWLSNNTEDMNSYGLDGHHLGLVAMLKENKGGNQFNLPPITIWNRDY